MNKLPDMQNNYDERGIAIDRVGVSDIRYPLHLPLKQGSTFHTVATVAMAVSIPARVKGTHMSRFMVALSHMGKRLHPHDAYDVLRGLLLLLDAKDAFIKVAFPIFLEKEAPVSKEKGLMDYECTFEAALSEAGIYDKLVGVKVNITSLCPCSKEISEYGAHNQRGQVSIKTRPKGDAIVWFEDLIVIAEDAGSSSLHPILKRVDEKHVTEQAYNNPKFVEDIVRDATIALTSWLPVNLAWFKVKCVNQESIHNHNAFARIERGERGPLLSGW